jgi:phosphopantothenoylcysteine decarboxylase
MKLLLGITASIAAYRIPNLVSSLKKLDYEIITLLTERAKAFVTPQSLAVMSQNACYTDEDEWQNTEHVIHIELAKWCDIFMIAPLSANTLAKMANGICDNLLTSTVRALGEKPLIIAPAMNTRMWENPLTRIHLDQLGNVYNLQIIEPVEKILADGDEGVGGLAEDQTIMAFIQSFADQK